MVVHDQHADRRGHGETLAPARRGSGKSRSGSADVARRRGGGAFDVKIDRPGIYPFVSHSFAGVNMGEVGLLKVGNVAGSMSH